MSLASLQKKSCIRRPTSSYQKYFKLAKQKRGSYKPLFCFTIQKHSFEVWTPTKQQYSQTRITVLQTRWFGYLQNNSILKSTGNSWVPKYSIPKNQISQIAPFDQETFSMLHRLPKTRRNCRLRAVTTEPISPCLRCGSYQQIKRSNRRASKQAVTSVIE